MNEPKLKRPKKSSQSKKKREAAAALEEERLLAASLFGPSANSAVSSASLAPATKPKRPPQTNDEFTFEIDRVGDSSALLKDDEEDHQQHQDDEDASSSSRCSDERDNDNKAAAWMDEDDQDWTVDLMHSNSRLRKLRRSKEETQPLTGSALEQRLRQRFAATTVARTDWAAVDTSNSNDSTKQKTDNDSDNDEEQDFVSSSAPLLASSGRRRLPPHTIRLKRCPDANQSDPNQSTVQACHFHPGSDPDKPLLLTAGLDKSLRFFQVTEDKSLKIHGIHCE